MLTMLGHSTPKRMSSLQPVRLAGSFRYWFVKKYCWLVCVREKYCSGWKFTIVYDRKRPAEQAVSLWFGYIPSFQVSFYCLYPRQLRSSSVSLHVTILA